MATNNSVDNKVYDAVTSEQIKTGVSATNKLELQAYDVDGASYTTFATLTANDTPTMDLGASVTKNGGEIYTGETTLGVEGGGTGLTSITRDQIIYGTSTTTLSTLDYSSSSDYSIIIGKTGSLPEFSSIQAGENIYISGNYIFASSDGLDKVDVDSDGSTEIETAVNTSYTINTTEYIAELRLPSSVSIGDIIEVSGYSEYGWKITQNANQVINVSSSSSTVGTSGYIASSNRYDCIIIEYAGSNSFTATSIIGTITVV